MGTKDQLLSLFEKNKGAFLSGEEIARTLGVSRAAVWKAVNSLRSEGYEIDAVPNKGYSLSEDTDILSAEGIRNYLAPCCSAVRLQVLPTVGSTNALAREQADGGAAEGLAVVANTQTQGRGRLGRRFYSPPDTGVYLSLLLRPQGLSPDRAVRITTMAAVSICEAIEQASGCKAWIKWVNDIYLDGKKVSGILTEASLGLEDGNLDYVVVGIGLNAYPPSEGFPPELADIAGTVFRERQSDGKNRLAAAFLNRFMSYYSAGDGIDYVQNYRARSLAIGKEIVVLSPAGPREAVALDIDPDCRLVVRYKDGRTGRLSSGEISIRRAR